MTPLTGLPNRFKFFETLDEDFSKSEFNSDEYSSSQGIEAAVLFINIKKLQRINESYGYELGDKALKAVAKLLQNTIHDKAHIARFSNDKFVIYLSEVHFENVKHEAHTLAKIHSP